MGSSERLLPCRACWGGKAKLNSVSHYVFCTNCGCHLKPSKNDELAIAAWNAPAALVDMVEGKGV